MGAIRIIDKNIDTLIICNPSDALHILECCEKDLSIDPQDGLVVTNIVPDGELVIVPRDEFIQYLNNNKRLKVTKIERKSDGHKD